MTPQPCPKCTPDALCDLHALLGDKLRLEQEPCVCVRCPACHGKGTQRIDDWSQPEGYDLETCAECQGAGITETCDRCHWLEDMDHE